MILYIDKAIKNQLQKLITCIVVENRRESSCILWCVMKFSMFTKLNHNGECSPNFIIENIYSSSDGYSITSL